MGWNSDKIFQFATRYQETSRFNSEQSLKELFLKVIEAGASDVLFTGGYPVIIQVHGRLWAITERNLEINELSQILNWLTDNAQAQAYIAQAKEVVGRYTISHPDHVDERGQRQKYSFRVNAVAGMSNNNKSVQIALRAIRPTVPTASEIDLDDELLKAVTSIESGVFYTGGETGSGKSTTFAAINRTILETDTAIKGNIFMLDRPIEYTFHSVKTDHSVVHQMEVGVNVESFAAGVESAMRHNPSLIVVGESRDLATVSATMSCAESGHPTFTTLHVNDVPTIFPRVLSFFEPNVRDSMLFQLVNTARVLLHQMLVPSTEGKLVALRSFLVMSDEMREQIIETADPRRITKVMKDMHVTHGRTREQAAERLFIAGRISEATYNRFKG